MGEDGGGKADLAPILVAEGIREFLAVETDLPGQQAELLERAAIIFGDGGVVLARKSEIRERAIVVELNEIRAAVDGVLGKPIRR